MVLTGAIQAGDRLVESDLAKSVGTSRTPVREALHSLEREGLLESIPRVGYVVTTISEGEVSELSGIRFALEDLALRWAFEKNRQKLIGDLRENVKRSEALLASGDVKSFVEMDAQFHQIISEKADSKHLSEITQSIRRHMLRYRIQSIYSMDNVQRAVAGHRSVFEALSHGDIRKALDALQAHIERSRKDILVFGFKNRGNNRRSL
jgi:DNA-binding GntR family transcriptional regulator